MGIVDTGQVKLLIAARERLAFIDQHSDAKIFQTRNHADRVVIA